MNMPMAYASPAMRSHAHGARGRHGRQRFLVGRAGLGDVYRPPGRVHALRRDAPCADRPTSSAKSADELRYATIIIQQTPQILEFVVADRNADGTAEKIRYEWSGTAGDPLRKTINGGTSVDVLTSVNAFSVTFQQKSKTTTLTPPPTRPKPCC